MGRPLFFAAMAYLFGALLGRDMAWPAWVWLLAMVLAWGLCLFCLFLEKSRLLQGGRSFFQRSDFYVLAAWACLAGWQHGISRERVEAAARVVEALPRGVSLSLSGTLVPDYSARDRRCMMTLKEVEIENPSWEGKSRLPGKIQLTLMGESADEWLKNPPLPGTRLRFQAPLRAPPPPRHFSLFDYGAYLERRDIFIVTTLWQAGKIEVLEPARPFTGLWKWRRGVYAQMDALFPLEQQGAIRAMLFGDTSLLDSETRRRFSRIGTAHLFAVSGLHTGFLAFLLFFLCRLVPLPRSWTVAIVWSVLIIYCVLVQFRAPVVRSTLMVVGLTLPFLTRRAMEYLHTLALAFLLTLLVDPGALWRMDFQFSYLCTFAILVLHPPLMEWLRLPDNRRRSFAFRQGVRWANNSLVGGALLFLVAQFALAPLLARHFHYFSIIGIVANLLMVPLAGLIIFLGWTLTLLHSLTFVGAGFLQPLLGGATGLFLQLARFFEALPGAAIYLPSFSWWLILAWYGLLFSGPALRMLRAPGEREKRRAGLALRFAALAVALIWWPLLARLPLINGEPLGKGRVTMLDVGQGDALLLENHQGKTLMIDAGPASSARTIADFLLARGIDRLDGLLLTHGDADHIGGAPFLLEAGLVDKVFLGPAQQEDQSGPLEKLRQALAGRAVTVERVYRGCRIRGMAPWELRVCHPHRAYQSSERNARSVTLWAEQGRMTWLFTGDAEAAQEREWIRLYGEELGEIEVLKAGHHGSHHATSADFLRHCRPALTLFSAGRKNRYGHPHPETVERARAVGSDVVCTAEQGTVEWKTDGRRLWQRVSR